MKYDTTYRSIGCYKTLDGRFEIKKHWASGVYFIHDFKEHKDLDEKDFYSWGMGKLGFGKLRDAKKFLEEHFYKEV